MVKYTWTRILYSIVSKTKTQLTQHETTPGAWHSPSADTEAHSSRTTSVNEENMVHRTVGLQRPTRAILRRTVNHSSL